ncbi:MAG: MOFRL family protein, partial [Niastella sp.]
QLTAQRGLSPEKYLEQNDSWNFFNQVSGHIITGPTHTNVMDIIVVLIP